MATDLVGLILSGKRGACNRKMVAPACGRACTRSGFLKRRRIIRTAEVTVETEEKTVLRGGQDQGATLMWCPSCRRQVAMVSPEHAAQIAGVSARTIYRWVETDALHFAEHSGRLLICTSALSRKEPYAAYAAQSEFGQRRKFGY